MATPLALNSDKLALSTLTLNSLSVLARDVHLSKLGIEPEVDKSGHTEYKLHLLTPTPHRFEKLKTQLKWRLIEGGGQALYELGVLDNGTLVGLAKSDMQGSLDTLGKLLASLGGGQVRIDKVFRLVGGGGGGEAVGGGGEHGLSKFAGDAVVDELEADEAAKAFASFKVEPDQQQLAKTNRSNSTGGEDSLLALDSLDDLVAGAALSASSPPPGPPAPLTGRRHKKLPPPPSADGKVDSSTARHWPQRTPHERAQLKRQKRDERRARVDESLAEGVAPDSVSASSSSATPPSAPRAIPPSTKKAYVNHRVSAGVHANGSGGSAPPKAHKHPGLKLSKSAPSASTPNKLRPSVAREGEERWVVEVELTKRTGMGAGGGAGRGKNAELEDDAGLDERDEEDEVEAESSDGPEHGWAYLEFDFLGPQQ